MKERTVVSEAGADRQRGFAIAVFEHVTQGPPSAIPAGISDRLRVWGAKKASHAEATPGALPLMLG